MFEREVASSIVLTWTDQLPKRIQGLRWHWHHWATDHIESGNDQIGDRVSRDGRKERNHLLVITQQFDTALMFSILVLPLKSITLVTLGSLSLSLYHRNPFKCTALRTATDASVSPSSSISSASCKIHVFSSWILQATNHWNNLIRKCLYSVRAPNSAVLVRLHIDTPTLMLTYVGWKLHESDKATQLSYASPCETTAEICRHWLAVIRCLQNRPWKFRVRLVRPHGTLVSKYPHIINQNWHELTLQSLLIILNH